MVLVVPLLRLGSMVLVWVVPRPGVPCSEILFLEVFAPVVLLLVVLLLRVVRLLVVLLLMNLLLVVRHNILLRLDPFCQGILLPGIPRHPILRLGIPRQGVPRLVIPRLGIPRLGVPRLVIPRYDVPRLGIPRQDILCREVPRWRIPCREPVNRVFVYFVAGSSLRVGVVCFVPRWESGSV